MLEELKDIFNSVYLPLTGEEYYFSNKNVEKGLNNFLKHIPEGAGEDWLYTFTVFQFSHYSMMKTRFDRIYLNWIYGEKALKRWIDRTEAQMYYMQVFKVKYGIHRSFSELPSGDYKDRERIRFGDTNRQFLHCDLLALFLIDNTFCKNCTMYSICKDHNDGL